MATKLNLSTPPAEIIKTLQEEITKSHRWFIKKSGGEAKRNMKVQKLVDTCKNDFFSTDIIPYEPPSGNRWINFDFGIKILDSVRFSAQYESAVIYETEGSIGCFYPIGHDFKVEGAFIFPSHFFLRYCDDIRKLDIMDGENTIVRFLAKNPYYKDKIYEKDGQKRIYLRLNGCIGLGYVLSEKPLVAEIRTVISDAMMTAQQKEDTKEIREQWLKDMKEMFSPDEQDEKSNISVGVIRKFQEHCKANLVQHGNYKSEDQVNHYATSFAELYAISIGVAQRTIGEDKITLDPNHIDAFVTKQMVRYCEKSYDRRITNNELMLTEHIDCITKILWHLNVDITRNQVLQDVLNSTPDVAKYYTNKLNQNNNMNQKAKTQFKNLLSRTGLTKKFSKYSEGIDNNLDRYIEQVESLYVFSRVYPFVADIKDKEKLISANKMWIQMVVENGFCKELETYIAENGKEMVIKAIHHLIDTDAWLSPEGNKALKVKQPTNYDGLMEIPNAIDYLQSITPETPAEETIAEENVTEEPATTIDFEEAEFIPSVENPTELTNNARHAVGMLLQFFNKAQDSINTLNDYWQNADEMETMLYNENNNLQRMIAKVEREKEDLLEQIRVSQQKLHDAEDKAKQQEQYAYEARKERAEAQRQLDTTRSELNKVQSEFNELKEKAKVSTLPVKKVLPESRFKRKMSIGPKTMDIIREVLDEFNIYIDPNK